MDAFTQGWNQSAAWGAVADAQHINHLKDYIAQLEQHVRNLTAQLAQKDGELQQMRFDRVLDAGVIAARNAQLQAVAAEIRACPSHRGAHPSLNIGEDGLQGLQHIYAETFDKELRARGIEHPERHR